MKSLILSALLICVLACPVAAQLEWVFVLDGEVAVPVSGPEDFTEKYGPIGYGAGAGFGAILSPQIMPIFMINYSLLPLDGEGLRTADNLPDDATISGGDITLWYVSFGLRYNVTAEPILHSKPYVVGGAGWYRIESEDVHVSSPTIGDKTGPGGYENVFGFNVGAGADIAVSPTVDAFVEVQYQAGLTSDSVTATIPIRGGLLFLLGKGN